MTPLEWSNEINIDNSTTESSLKFTLANLDTFTSTVFNGSGFTYDINGRPTGGTITSVQLVDNSDQSVLQTVTGFTTTFAQLGTFIDQVVTLKNQVPWVNPAGSPINFTSTQIRLPNQDGTFTDVIG